MRQRVLIVAIAPLGARPALERTAAAVAAAGWETSIAAPARSAIAGSSWYPLTGSVRSAVKRVRRLAAQADLVVVDPDGLRIAQRAQLRAPLVLIVDEELLGSRARALHNARIDLAVATSESAAEPVRWRGIETVVMPAPIAPGFDRASKAPRNVVGCATRFDVAAGLDVLLEAFAALPRTDLCLEVVNIDGDDDDRVAATLRARAARPDLDGRVRIVERGDDLRGLMREWRVAVTANVGAQHHTGALRDAIELGVPVVATNRGANAEVVGNTGLLVRAGRVEELTGAIAAALEAEPPQDAIAARTASPAGSQPADLVGLLGEVAERGVRRRAGTIVFVVPDFEPTLGGTTRQTHNQASELRARGYDVLVLTQRLELHWPRSERRNGLPLRRVGPSGRTFLRMKLLVLSVARWLRRHRDHIAVVNVIMYPDFVVSAALAGLADRTVMCWAGLGDATDTVGTSARCAHRCGRSDAVPFRTPRRSRSHRRCAKSSTGSISAAT